MQRFFPTSILCAALCVALLSSCSKTAPQAAANQATEVGYVVVAPQNVSLTEELPGRTVAFRTADVRPQVNGLIRSLLFKEGSDVKAGTALYQIDPATYQASVASAQAALNKAQAAVRATDIQAQRYSELIKIKAISKQDYDNAMASMKEGRADVLAAQAALDASKINLNYSKITAPISGRVGKSAFSVGALVTASQTTALATIQQLDPMYVEVSQSATDALRLRQAISKGSLEGSAARTSVTLVLSDGSHYASKGTLTFADAAIDTTSDSMTLRATFANPHNELLPGMFVRAILNTATLPSAILVPQSAVMRDSTGKPMVWVIGADDKVAQRMVTTGQISNNQWVIADGLQAGDKLVVDGFQKTKVGAPVKGVLVDPAAQTPVAAATDSKKE